MSEYVQNNDGTPIVFYHSTNHAFNEQSFLPFSHFGTCQAANQRWVGKGYRIEGARFIPALLKIKNPLRVRDTGDTDIVFGVSELIKAGIAENKLEWIYQPLLQERINKRLLLEKALNSHRYSDFNPAELSIKGSQNIRPSLSEIFFRKTVRPISIEHVVKELNQESIYPFKTEWQSFNNDEDYLLRKSLKNQRKILALEHAGYDGLVYDNREEDVGSDTYCIFRPSQVVPALTEDWKATGYPKPTVNYDHYRLSYVFRPFL